MLRQTENIYEKRLVNRLKSYWERLKGEEDLPMYSRFSGEGISDMWESCLHVKVINSGAVKVYQIQHVGRELREPLGKDLEGKYFTSYNAEGALSKSFIKVLDNCIENRAFLSFEGSFVSAMGRVIKFRDCVLPFKDMHNEIKNLVVGISWRSFS